MGILDILSGEFVKELTKGDDMREVKYEIISGSIMRFTACDVLNRGHNGNVGSTSCKGCRYYGGEHENKRIVYCKYKGDNMKITYDDLVIKKACNQGLDDLLKEFGRKIIEGMERSEIIKGISDMEHITNDTARDYISWFDKHFPVEYPVEKAKVKKTFYRGVWENSHGNLVKDSFWSQYKDTIMRDPSSNHKLLRIEETTEEV